MSADRKAAMEYAKHFTGKGFDHTSARYNVSAAFLEVATELAEEQQHNFELLAAVKYYQAENATLRFNLDQKHRIRNELNGVEAATIEKYTKVVNEASWKVVNEASCPVLSGSAALVGLELAARICDGLSKRDYGPYGIDRQEHDEEISEQCATAIRAEIAKRTLCAKP